MDLTWVGRRPASAHLWDFSEQLSLIQSGTGGTLLASGSDCRETRGCTGLSRQPEPSGKENNGLGPVWVPRPDWSLLPFACAAGIRRRTPLLRRWRSCRLCADLVAVGGKRRTDGSEMACLYRGRVVEAQVDHSGTLQLRVTEGRVASEESGGSCAPRWVCCERSSPAPSRSNPLPQSSCITGRQSRVCFPPNDDELAASQSRPAKNAVGGCSGCRGCFRAAAQTNDGIRDAAKLTRYPATGTLTVGVLNPTLVSALGRHRLLLSNELREHNERCSAHSVVHGDIHTASSTTTCLPTVQPMRGLEIPLFIGTRHSARP